jgi:hypothetical protein
VRELEEMQLFLKFLHKKKREQLIEACRFI